MTTSQRARVYWLCQLIGWSAYGVLVFILYTLMGVPKLRMALHSVVYVSAAIGLTHLLRGRIQMHGWAQMRIPMMIWRVLLSSAALAVGLTVVIYVSSGFFFPRAKEHAWTQTAFLVMNLGFVLLSWQLIYFAAHWLERAVTADVDRWRLTAAAQDAELRFLRAQMHPHFLFNCLNSLRGLIAEDTGRAQTMVTQLSSIFRHSLAAETSLTVPLAKEMEVVRDYLSLESVRLEERLQVKIDITPESLSAQVPAMLVQTLVENAIKHGVARVPLGGEVAVSAQVVDAFLELHVRSPLPALPSEPLNEQRGVGLANARERLRLLFGDRASLSLTATAQEGASARVVIPLKGKASAT